MLPAVSEEMVLLMEKAVLHDSKLHIYSMRHAHQKVVWKVGLVRQYSIESGKKYNDLCKQSSYDLLVLLVKCYNINENHILWPYHKIYTNIWSDKCGFHEIVNIMNRIIIWKSLLTFSKNRNVGTCMLAHFLSVLLNIAPTPLPPPTFAVFLITN